MNDLGHKMANSAGTKFSSMASSAGGMVMDAGNMVGDAAKSSYHKTHDMMFGHSVSFKLFYFI